MVSPLPQSNMVRRQQPQQPTPIDWSNPITKGLVFAYVLGGTNAFGYGEDGKSLIPYIYGNMSSVSAAPVITNWGYGAKAVNASYPIIGVPPTQRSVTSAGYSLFAVGNSTSNSTTQSAVDDDDGNLRRFQFRLNSASPEFIGFNTSGTAITITGTALSAATLASGFTMGAAVNTSTASVWSNGRKTSGALANISTPNSQLWVGSRKTATTPWSNGALSLVMMWNRPLLDMEMQSLSVNPWQIFKAPSSMSMMAALAARIAIQQRALYIDNNGIVRQSPGGLSVKPLALVNGVLRPQVTNETPVVLVNGKLRQLKSSETLVL